MAVFTAFNILANYKFPLNEALNSMKILSLLLTIMFLVSCDNSIPERREVENSSELLGKTFATTLPLAYKINLPRYSDVSKYIMLNSETIFADEVDRKITGITSDCANCIGESRLTTPIRIKYIPIGTKFTVVDEYMYYSDYGSWINGPTNIHTLILKDEFGNLSEMSELGFMLDFVDDRFTHRDLRKEESLVLNNINSLLENEALSLVFCIANWLESPGELSDFISDFQLEKEVAYRPEATLCDNGYEITFKTTEAYLTSIYYFNDWRLYGEWHKFNK